MFLPYCYNRDHPLTGLPSFSEFVRPWPSSALRRESLPWGCKSPLRDINHKQRLNNTEPPQARHPLRPWRFARLRRFSPLMTLWTYFIPLPRAGFSFRGFLLPHDCRQLVAANHSLSSFYRCRLKAVAHFRQLHRFRPQGFVPCGNPCRHSLVIHQRVGPIPSWFFLLQVFTRNSIPCLHTLCRPTPCRTPVTVMRAIDLWRLLPRLACVSRHCRPARGSGPTRQTILRLSFA